MILEYLSYPFAISFLLTSLSLFLVFLQREKKKRESNMEKLMHEFRTPLHALLSATERLEREKGMSLKGTELITVLKKNVLVLTKLMEDFTQKKKSELPHDSC